VTSSSGFYAAGYLTGLIAFVLMAKRRRLLTEGVLTLMAAGVVGGLVCANLSQWLIARTEGKSVLGALAGGYLSVHIGKKILGIRRPLGDLFAVALSAGEAVGRWGCFCAGCCYGKPCGLPWSVWQHGAFRHPTQIYLSLASLSILVVLLAYERRNPPENSLFFLQGCLYCCARFVIEFARDGQQDYAGLSAAQWACLFGGAFFAFQLHRRMGQCKQSVTIPADANSLG
jgi:phosphatidylglycerol:prolipoprotein diacylglycerol transferase